MIKENKLLNNKIITTFLFSIISIFIVVIITYLGITKNLKWNGLIVGLILIVISIPVYFLGKKKNELYILSFLLNTVSTGFSISTYYTIRSIPFDLYQVTFSLLIVVIILFLSYYLIKKTFLNKSILFTIIITILILLALLWFLNEKTTIYSISFFLLINSLFYIILFYSLKNKEEDIYKSISSYSFGIYFVITIIVIAILTEGNVDFDVGYWRDNKKKKK